MVELFFDLVFVFAVTQLSHTLLANLTAGGGAQVLLLMLAGLMMSISIPKAFGERGLLFASAYASMQVGRTLFFLWAVRGGTVSMRRNFQRILAWLATAAVFWIVGGFSEGWAGGIGSAGAAGRAGLRPHAHAARARVRDGRRAGAGCRVGVDRPATTLAGGGVLREGAALGVPHFQPRAIGLRRRARRRGRVLPARRCERTRAGPGQHPVGHPHESL